MRQNVKLLYDVIADTIGYLLELGLRVYSSNDPRAAHALLARSARDEIINRFCEGALGLGRRGIGGWVRENNAYCFLLRMAPLLNFIHNGGI